MRARTLLFVGLGGAALFLLARAARAAPTGPFVPRIPGEAPALPSGPLAGRMDRLLASLPQSEIDGARAIMPPHFWDAVVASTLQPTDELFRLSLQPMSMDVSLWSRARMRQFESEIVAAIGMWDALTLQRILQDAGVM